MNSNDPNGLDRDSLLQVEAERAEREGHAPGADPRVDRYRLIVRALREPLEPQLPADFATSVAARARRRIGDVVEDLLVAVLLFALGIVALNFLLPALARAVQVTANVALPSLPWQQALMAAIGIGVVWAVELGWVHLHAAPPRRR